MTKAGLLVWNKLGTRYKAAFHLWYLSEHFQSRNPRVSGALHFPLKQKPLVSCTLFMNVLRAMNVTQWREKNMHSAWNLSDTAPWNEAMLKWLGLQIFWKFGKFFKISKVLMNGKNVNDCLKLMRDDVTCDGDCKFKLDVSYASRSKMIAFQT